jgi:DNA polymerase-3 subunit epsilon
MDPSDDPSRDASALRTCARLLDLERPLVILDLETTGVDVESDRVIQVGMARLEPGDADGGDPETMSELVDPGVPVPDDVQGLTGITEAMLEGAPAFDELAPRINAFVEGADLCGYNAASFDVPFLEMAFERCGRTFNRRPGAKVLDVLRIFQKKEPHTLERAVAYYTGRPARQSHRALSDVLDTGSVLAAQLARYGLSGTAEEIAAEIRHPHIDAEGKLKRDGDRVVLCFGKHEGRSVEAVEAEAPGYLDWVVREIGGEVGAAVAERRTELRDGGGSSPDAPASGSAAPGRGVSGESPSSGGPATTGASNGNASGADAGSDEATGSGGERGGADGARPSSPGLFDDDTPDEAPF